MKILAIYAKNTIYTDPMVFLPLGLAWIRAVLVERGYDVDYIDMSEYYKNNHGDHINKYPDVNSIPMGYDLYLVSGTSPQAKEIRSIGRFLKEKGKPAIAGGPHVTNYAGLDTPRGSPIIPDDALPIDMGLVSNYPVMVKHEGEEAIFEAIERIEEGTRALKNYGRGIVIRGEVIKDLGSIPIPDRRDAHKYKFNFKDKNGTEHPCTSMFTSRGCPNRCAFCDSPGLWTRQVRYTPIYRVREEFEQIRDLGFSSIMFCDDILPLNRPRMLEMCDLLKKMDFVWRCSMRVDIISHRLYGKDFLHKMYDAGMIECLVGVESGSQQILDNIYKNTTTEQNTIVRQWCKEIGVKFKATVILGLPGETMETMEATRRWVLDNKPDYCGVSVFVPFSGTPIVDQKTRKLYGINDMREFDLHIELPSNEADEYFFSGARTKLQSVVVSTSSLTAKQISDYYLKFSAELEALGIPH